MAFTEKYVTVAGAGAHDGTTEGNAWTFAEAIAAAPAAGTRINIKAGAYSTGATALPTAGTIASWVAWRGYNSSIGDLDTQGRNADGTLNTTNFPVITLTGGLTWVTKNYFQNVVFTGALSAYLFLPTTIDEVAVLSCSVTNTQNNAAAGVLSWDNNVTLKNSDFACTGAAHGVVLDSDLDLAMIGCRVKGVAAIELLQLNASCTILKSVFIGNGAVNKGIRFVANPTPHCTIEHNTFYNLATCIEFANAALGITPNIDDNIVTDCTKYLDNLYTATSNLAVLESNNRTRDNTTPRTGIGDGANVGEITTDTGGAETDYVNAGAGNLRLIAASPAINAAMVSGDCGAYQRVPDFPDAGNVTEDDTTDGVTGTYHEATVGEVVAGVTFGAASALTGTYSPDFPSVGNVHNDDTVDGVAGTLTTPAVGDVESGVQYGAGGTEFTGTFAKPAVGDVQSGVQYGAGGTEFTGTFTEPGVANVKAPTQYGAGGTEFTGTYSPDFPAVSNVQNDDTVDGSPGTLTVPAVGNVVSGIQYGGGGNEFTGTYAPDFPSVGNVTQDDTVNGAQGTYVEPNVNVVLSPNQFGANGTEKTGTYTPDFPSVSNVLDDDTVNGSPGVFESPVQSDVYNGVGYGANGSEFTGTYTPDFPAVGNVTEDDTVDSVPGEYVEVAEADVELGVQYGASGTEKTGTLVVGGSGVADYPEPMTFGD